MRPFEELLSAYKNDKIGVLNESMNTVDYKLQNKEYENIEKRKSKGVYLFSCNGCRGLPYSQRS